MIIGLDDISSPDLRYHITQIYKEMCDKAFSTSSFSERNLNDIIHHHVLGIDNRPICICDGKAYLSSGMFGDQYDVELLIDYRVAHFYKPYQPLDKPLHIYFTISKSIIRNNKLNELLNINI